jgi:hypothetical protein
MERYYTESRRRGVSYIQHREGRLNGLGTSCVRSAFREHVIEGRVEGRIDDGRTRKKT